MNNFLDQANTKHGQFVFFSNDDPIGACLSYYGEWAQQELDLFDSILTDSSNVIDVGANIGTHTVFFSKKCYNGNVVSVEPQLYISQILNTNILINGCFNVIPIRAACGSNNEEKRMINFNPFVSNKVNYGEFKVNSDADRGLITDCIKLDNLLKLDIDFDLIKIDVEGMEADVIKGASKLITKYKPALYIEFNNKNGDDKLISLLQSIGYNSYWHVYTKHNPGNHNKKSKNVWEEDGFELREHNTHKRYEGNILCIHKSKKQPEELVPVSAGDNIQKFLFNVGVL